MCACICNLNIIFVTGKKKVDPDFIGTESESITEGRTDPLILEAVEPSSVVKHEQDNQTTNQEDNVDWEGFSDVITISLSSHF